MNDLEPIEGLLRTDELLDPDVDLVVRGWPLTVEGLLVNADATRSRFSLDGRPLSAISAEATVDGWTLGSILGGPRLRTRSRYATVSVGALVEAAFGLLPTFGARPTTACSSSPTLLSEPSTCSICSARPTSTRTT